MAVQTKDKVEEVFRSLLTSSSATQVRKNVFLLSNNLSNNKSTFFALSDLATKLRQNVEKGYAPQQQDATAEEKVGRSFSNNNGG